MTATIPDDEMRALPGVDARLLAELYLLAHDLEHAVRALRILVDVYGEREFSEPEQVTRLALYRDALLQFTACFDGTAPLFLTVAEVYAGDPNAQSYFDSLKALRDNFAAHRHGPSRQCVVGVIAGENGPFGFGHLKIVFHVPEPLELKHTHDFIFKARRHVQRRIDELLAQVTHEARTLSRAEILALPGAHGYNVRPEEMDLSRARFEKRRSRADRQGSDDVT